MLTLTDKMGAKMNRAFAVLALLVTIAVSPQVSRAQGETAVPFLLIPPSAEGNGMGGIVNATETDRPMGILANPGLLGISSLDHFFLGGLYPSSTTWLPGIPGSHVVDDGYRPPRKKWSRDEIPRSPGLASMPMGRSVSVAFTIPPIPFPSAEGGIRRKGTAVSPCARDT